MQLTKAEEQIMKYLWKLEKAFLKDLLHEFPEPKPANTTILTLLKRMIDKGFVYFKQYGNVREYYPGIKKSEYFSNHINGIVKNFFNGSASQFASFYTNETNLTLTDLEEIRKMIDKQLENHKKK